MKNESLKKFLAKNGQDADKILKDKKASGHKEPDGDEDDLMEPKRKLTVSDDPKWKGKLGKHDDCWK
jgi:hypothetical protein